MTVSEKIKTIDNKIEQNKAQYDLDRKTAKMSALSKKMLINKYEFLTYKVVSPGKDFLEKAATVKRFEYSPLGSELKEDTDIAKKQYQELDKAFFSSIYNKSVNESLIQKEPVAKTIQKIKYNKSNPIFNRLRFYSYSDNKKFDRFSTKIFISIQFLQ